MNSEPQKVRKWRFIPEGICIGALYLLLIFRFTAAAAFLVFLLLCVFYRLHRSRRALYVVFGLFLAAILIPVDVYIQGFDGPLCNSQHSGPRFVPVLHGYGAHFKDGREFIDGGCVVGLYDTRWRLVWD
ncbi:MAG TPA: hypothetical protein VFB72_04030 [Verrucomicrobiae bacterium]|nr:hypothetical protein [Verrucomicrobiae bacterium]